MVKNANPTNTALPVLRSRAAEGEEPTAGCTARAKFLACGFSRPGSAFGRQAVRVMKLSIFILALPVMILVLLLLAPRSLEAFL